MRRLVVCCDGTWNKPDQSADGFDVRKLSNIVKIVRAVLPKDESGVGYHPTIADAYERVDNGPGGVSWQNEENSRRR